MRKSVELVILTPDKDGKPKRCFVSSDPINSGDYAVLNNEIVYCQEVIEEGEESWASIGSQRAVPTKYLKRVIVMPEQKIWKEESIVDVNNPEWSYEVELNEVQELFLFRGDAMIIMNIKY